MMDENSAGCASEAVAPLVLAPKVTCIPVRVFNRDGMTIYSKVDDQMIDLSDTNCEGHVIHTSSYYVPRGATLPAPTISQDVEPAGVVCSHDNCSRMVDCGPYCLNTNERSHAVSQDVPAPAAVTAEMAADIAAAREWVEAQPDDDENYHQDYFDGLAVTKRALASLAALSAATPLQSDLAAENARLREALKVFADAANAADDPADGYLDRHDLWESPIAMQVTVGDLRLARAARTPAQTQTFKDGLDAAAKVADSHRFEQCGPYTAELVDKVVAAIRALKEPS